MGKRSLHWTQQEPPYQVGKDGFSHLDLPKDYDGWVDAKQYHPFPYDLVKMRIEKKSIRGWWNGQNWEGLRLAPEDEVLYWKFEKEEEECHSRAVKAEKQSARI